MTVLFGYVRPVAIARPPGSAPRPRKTPRTRSSAGCNRLICVAARALVLAVMAVPVLTACARLPVAAATPPAQHYPQQPAEAFAFDSLTARTPSRG